MTVKGRVKGRSIELAEPLPELEGQEVVVSVEAAMPVNGMPPGEQRPSRGKGPAILEMGFHLLDGLPEEELARLPADLAEQHDHYASGAPRRTCKE